MFEWACNLCQGVVFRNHVYIGWKETKKKQSDVSRFEEKEGFHESQT